MIQQQKRVAKILSYLIRRFFIISNSYIKTTLQILQQTVAVNNEKLHYIKKKIVTQKEKCSVTGVWASSVIYCFSNWWGEHRKTFFEERRRTMEYRVVPLFDDNEKDFIEDVSLNIDNALAENQEIPNEQLVSATKELIEQHCIDFEELMNMLKNYKSNLFIWELNGFDHVFEIEMVSKIEKVLFETHKQLVKEIEEE